MTELVFLKLGGSLITDKTKPYTLRPDKLLDLAREIKSALAKPAAPRLILGHGSGSFGHFAVKEHLPHGQSLAEAESPEQYWRGYAEVWFRASQLNRHVIEALHETGVPAISLPASALVGSAAGSITTWDLRSIRAALEAGLMPVIYGDVVFDELTGGVVLSTEHLMFYLAHHLPPQRILLAGLEAAVWADFPARQAPVERVTPATYELIAGKLGGSHGQDVTGGMKTKVEEMLHLVQEVPGMTVQIFSGEIDGNLEKVLAGEQLGTLISI